MKENKYNRLKTKRSVLAHLLCSMLVGQTVPAYASQPVQVATGGTQVDQTSDGVAVINIAPPNQAGISHNQYHQFNVEQQGAILNNSAGQSAQTQLAGSIAANPNLAADQAAAGIVNEVVSANRSQLKGYLEVAGKAASVVVANPYGITCDGCGFINTPHAVLTTGKPEWGEKGELQALKVVQGDILLQGKGLDASQSDKLSLITRAAQLDAQLRGRETTVVLGSNRVTAEGQIIPLESTGKSLVAIDTGALGGMYSNSIRLVASEKGVGVNLANLTATQGDIRLDSNGELVLNKATAKGDLLVQSQRLKLHGVNQAAGDIQLSAEYLMAESTTVQAGKKLDIQSDVDSDNSVFKAKDNIIFEGEGIYSRNDHWESEKDIIIQGGVDGEGSEFVAKRNIVIKPNAMQMEETEDDGVWWMNNVSLANGGLTAKEGDIDIHAEMFSLSSLYDESVIPWLTAGGDISIYADAIGIYDNVIWKEDESDSDNWTGQRIRPVLSSQGHLTLNAKYEMHMQYAVLKADKDISIRTDYYYGDDEGYDGSYLSFEDNNWDEKLNVGYTEIDSGGDVDFNFGEDAYLLSTKVNAKGDVNIVSDGMLYLGGSNGSYSNKDYYSEVYIGVEFNAKNISIKANDLSVEGGSFRADYAISLSSFNDLNISGGSVLFEGFAEDDDQLWLINDLWKATSLTAGGPLSLTSYGNINASSVQFSSGSDIRLDAKGDIILASEYDSTEPLYGKSSLSWIETGATLLTSARDIILDAGSDIITHASVFVAGRDIALDSGGNINLNAMETEDYRYDRNYDKDTVKEEDYFRQVSTELTGGRNIRITAEQDIVLSAGQLDAGGKLSMISGRDISLRSATESDYYFYEKNTSSNNIISSTHTQIIEQDYATLEKGSLLSAGSVSLFAVNDLELNGSAVISDGDLYVTAGNTMALTAASEEFSSVRIENTSKSGIFSGGSFGFTIGKKSSRHKVEESGITQSQSISTLGSTGGDIIINAGGQADLTGVNIIAARKIALSGRDIQIQPGRDNLQRYERLEYKVQGLTVALSGMVTNAITSAINIAHSVRDTGSSRLTALRGIQAMLSGVQVAQSAEVSADDSSRQMVGISISLGQQKSLMERRDSASTAIRSGLSSGDSINIAADNNLLIAGSQLKAGGDIALEAGQNLLLAAAANTWESSSKNSSSGGSVGVSFGVGQSTGFSVFAGANYSKGSENGTTTEMIETLINSGNQVSLSAGQDIALVGAQVSGEKVVVRAGNNLSLISLQDSDSYEAKQDSISGNMSVAIFGAGGSANISAGSERINSDFQSVMEQTGIFAGSGGFDIEVQGDSWLDGAVISSRASAENNRLQTGTLGWRDILNSASYETEQTGISVGTGGGGGSFGGNSDSDSSWTRSAISPSQLLIMASEAQRQDIAALSHDVENANQQLSPIFDLEKEQKRLQELQLIGAIGVQVSDIVRTQGIIAGLEARKDPQALSKAEAELRQEGYSYSEEDIAQRAYNNAMQQYGTGSDYQKAVQSVTALLQGLAGNNLAQAVAGASSPYVAAMIKSVTGSDTNANLLAHALWAAVSAELTGQSVAGNTAGVMSGEIAARLISQLYPDTPVEKLSEEQKQQISALSTIASGIAAGAAGGSVSDAITGSQAGKNAVDNNYLSADQALAFDRELQSCSIEGDCDAVRAKYRKLSDDNSEKLTAVCIESPLTCEVYYKELIQGGIATTERPDWLYGSMSMEEAKTFVLSQNVSDLALIDTTSESWMKFASLVSDPENQAVAATLARTSADLVKAAWTFMSRNSATATVSATEVGLKWSEGINKQGMPWEDYVGTSLPADARLPQNFKTFDYYDGATKTAVSAKSMDTQTMAKLANPNQVYSSIKGNIDAAAKFERSQLSGRELTPSMISNREIQLAVPANTTKIQWTEINRAIEYGKAQGVKVTVTQVK